MRTGGARVGEHVLVTEGIALEGTAILAHDFSDVALRLGLSNRDLAEARRLMAEVSIVPEAVELAARGVTAMHDVTRGGLLETLMEIAYLAGVGIEVDAPGFRSGPSSLGLLLYSLFLVACKAFHSHFEYKSI